MQENRLYSIHWLAKKLARTSKTPGRTQRLFVFDAGDNRRVVDLPGYGYAKAPVSVREQLAALIEDYLYGRRSLAGIVLIMDIRHPLKDQDKIVLNIARGRGLPVHLVLSKSDKLKRGAMSQQLMMVKKQSEEGVTVQTFSAFSRFYLLKQGVGCVPAVCGCYFPALTAGVGNTVGFTVFDGVFGGRMGW